MKRFATLLLALLMAASLWACSAQPAQQEPTTAPETPAPTEAPGIYTPGVYTGEAQGFGGKVTVTVTVDANAIVSVEAVGADETAGIGSNAVDQLPAKIVEAQSTQVDGISGATRSSDAIKQAVEAALAAARGEETEQAAMTPGVYTAEAKGFSLAEPLQVAVTVTEDAITNIEVNADNAETEPVFNAALQIIPRILESQSLGVDTITGATLTSGAIRTAATDAVKQALAAAAALRAPSPPSWRNPPGAVKLSPSRRTSSWWAWALPVFPP